MIARKKILTKELSLQAFFCRYCAKRFGYYEHFRRHSLRHRGQKHRKPTGYNQSRPDEVRTEMEEENENCHIMRHSLSHQGWKPCKPTGYNHKDNEARTAVEEEAEECFNCVYCNQQFLSKFGLEGHLACHAIQTLPMTPPAGERSFHNRFPSSFPSSPASLYSPLHVPSGVISSPMLSPPSSEEFNTVLYKCRYCPKSFTEDHVKEVHERRHFRQKYTMSYQCGYCSQSFTSKAVCKLHQRTHLQGEFFSCDACPFSSLSKKILRNHKKKHCPKRKKPNLKCKKCSEKFPSKSKLAKHLRTHIKKNKRKKKVSQETVGEKESVDVLPLEEEAKSDPVLHDSENVVTNLTNEPEDDKESAHPRNTITGDIKIAKTAPTVQWEKLNGQTLFTCNFCRKAFVNQDTLNAHRKFHVKRPKIYYGSVNESKSSSGQIRYTCDLCKKTFAGKMTLVSHRRTHVLEPKIHVVKSADKARKQVSHKEINMKRKWSEVSVRAQDGEDEVYSMHNSDDFSLKKKSRYERSRGTDLANHTSKSKSENCQDDENNGPRTSETFDGERDEIRCNGQAEDGIDIHNGIANRGASATRKQKQAKQAKLSSWIIPRNGQIMSPVVALSPLQNRCLDSKKNKMDEAALPSPKTPDGESSHKNKHTVPSPKASDSNNGCKDNPKACVVYKCDQCGKNISTKPALIAHKKSHSRYSKIPPVTGDFKCKQCHLMFSTDAALKEHVVLKGRGTKCKTFKCQKCEKCYTTLGNLNNHNCLPRKTCDKKINLEKGHQCSQCSKSYFHKGELTRHMLTHTGVRPFVCQHCGQSFAKKFNMKRHENRHTGAVSYKCQYCGESFSSPDDMHYHEQKHKPIENKYSCKLCDKTFAYSAGLAYHVESVHAEHKTYKCEVCAKSFGQKGDLVVHKRVHKGEKPYKCAHSDCDKTFRAKHQLSKHEKCKHNVDAEKSFQCHLCVKRYSLKRYLEIHLKKKHAKKKYRLVVKMNTSDNQVTSPKSPSSDSDDENSESSCSDSESSSEADSSDSELPSDLESVSSVSSSSDDDSDEDD